MTTPTEPDDLKVLIAVLRARSEGHATIYNDYSLFAYAADRIQTLEAALAAEREACAKVAEREPLWGKTSKMAMRDAIAAAIRARSIQDRVG